MKKIETEKLSNLTGLQLFAILLAELHVKYDHGGYSFGRSLQADLIEFRHLIPHCGFSIDYSGSLSEEITKRIKNAEPQHMYQPVFDLGMTALTTPELIQHSLKGLVWWYEHHAKSKGFLDEESPIMVQRLYALHRAIYGDLTFDQQPDLKTLQELNSEIRARYMFHLKEKYRYFDYALLINQPLTP